MRFFFISTRHLPQRLWFKDAEDFKVAMNYVAIAVAATGVNVLAFILMSNHVHFLLGGTHEAALRFINLLKTLYGRYFRKKYGGTRLLKHNPVDIQEVTHEPEGIERTVAYIQQNSVAARICLHCNDYPWGSGGCFFSLRGVDGIRVGDYSKRARIRMFRSSKQVPEEWLVCKDGYILPESYVCIKYVESAFRSAPRMVYYLNNSSKARRSKDTFAPSFRDQLLLDAAKDLAQSLFHKPLTHLPDSEKADLLKNLRWRFSADINQLCRILNLTYKEASNLLDKV